MTLAGMTHIKIYTCYYFDDRINNNIPFDNILLDEKSCENILIYVAHKTPQNIPYSEKPWHITFNKVEGYIKKYDSTKYLALFHSDE